jgi:Concanavalin A-like lectin/glucanases superfamily
MMIRRQVLAMLPALPLLLRPRRAHAVSRWQASQHALNHPARCAGWWLVTPTETGTRWDSLLGGHRGVGGTSATMAVPPIATSGISHTTQRRGGFGEVRFDGTDLVTEPVLLEDPPTMSLSCWLRYSTSLRGIITKGTDYNAVSWFLRVHSGDASVGFWFVDGVGNNRGLISTRVLNDDLWHHVVISIPDRTAPASWLFVIDGTPDFTPGIFEQGVLGSVSNGEPVRFGNFGNLANPFTGRLDDIRLYTQALSLYEAQVLYGESLYGYPTLLARPRALAVAVAAAEGVVTPVVPTLHRSLFFGGP